MIRIIKCRCIANALFYSCCDISENKAVGVMKAGNTFTIEPMINAGSYNDDRWPDSWTAVTVVLFIICFFGLQN